MAPGRKAAAVQQQSQEPTTEAADGPPTIRTADGRVYSVAHLPDTSSDQEPSTDTVAERLDGAFSPDIVEAVKQYGKPEWEKPDSQLDPIDDIETYYEYDFKLPPDVHDGYAAAAEAEDGNLAAMRALPISPELRQQIEQRRALVQDRTAEELRWMKHKAYYSGVSKIRAAKQALQAALDEDLAAAAEAAEAAEAAAAAGAQPAAAAAAGAGTGQQQQQHREPSKLSMMSEEEVLAEISDPSEWDTSHLAASYQQHPDMKQQLCSAFAAGLGLQYLTPQQMQQQQQRWQELAAVAEAEQQREQQMEAAREEFWQKHKPYQAFTPEFLDKQKRQQQLDAHRRHKQQAFWLSLGMALGSSAVRWWLQRGSKTTKRSAGRKSGTRRSANQAIPEEF